MIKIDNNIIIYLIEDICGIHDTMSDFLSEKWKR